MKNIMIIGAGQLGSRHLQGVVQSKLPLKILVVDPSFDSLELAKSRANEISFGNQTTLVEYQQAITSLTDIDICIIATTANVRFKVFQELIAKCTVNNIIFEKVLFQKEEEYKAVEELLANNKINAWVNCPRRVFPAYQNLQFLLVNESNISMTVTGSNWGLACNSIHFIDLFSFLSGNSDFELDCSLLEDVVGSKRNGFYETFGKLSGRDKNKNIFELCCSDDDEKVNIEVKIETSRFEVLIKETHGELIVTNKGIKTVELYQPLYQSQLTHLNVEEIVTLSTSSLTSFADSKKIHLPFIRSIKQHIESSLNEQLDACPIT